MNIKIRQAVLAHNDAEAAENARIFHDRGFRVVNVMASPGAGKTSLILCLIDHIPAGLTPLVIEGDCASSVDADRVSAAGVGVVQINTDGGCHLEAGMVRKAFIDLSGNGPGVVFIENIGNLICPVEYDLGEDMRLVVASVPEGDDKPLKYPYIFAAADVIVLNKIDLAEHVEFDIASFHAGVRAVNDHAQIFEVSCKSGDGLKPLTKWLFSTD
ncbi:MAG: hydrogenase nickel incorporation protein HypB [Candidatus Riflebacteria bacterium]|nr:hydrogenase nickel incorporation protein HypB [Candidatus Riflebacteria bacterium]